MQNSVIQPYTTHSLTVYSNEQTESSVCMKLRALVRYEVHGVLKQ